MAPPARQGRASLLDSKMWNFQWRLSEGQRMSWCRQRRLWKQSLRCQRCQSSWAEHEWMHPPSPSFRLVFPDVFPPISLLLTSSVSWNIPVGQKSPHWGLQGCIMRINELEVNMQAVCCSPLYTSQPIGFHQKLRWIVLPKAHNNAAQCFIYLKRNSKAISKRFYMNIYSHLEHFVYMLLSVMLIFTLKE